MIRVVNFSRSGSVNALLSERSIKVRSRSLASCCSRATGSGSGSMMMLTLWHRQSPRVAVELAATGSQESQLDWHYSDTPSFKVNLKCSSCCVDVPVAPLRHCDSRPPQSAARHADRNSDGVLDFKEFTFLCSRHPVVVYPVFRLQVRGPLALLWHFKF